MALQKQIVEVPLGSGLQTKADPKIVQPGAMLVVQNGEFDELGAVSKRNGYTALSTGTIDGGSISAGVALAKRRDEILLMDGASLYTRTSAGWASKGDLRTMGLKTKRVGATAGIARHAGTAVANSFAVYISVAPGPVTKATVVDLTTGAEVISGQTLGGTPASYPRLTASGDYIYVVQVEGANVKMYALDTTSPTAFAAAVNLATNAGGGKAFDIASMGSGAVACAYESTTPDVRVVKFDHTGTTTGPTTVAENPASGIGIAVSAALDIYVAYRQATTNDVRCFALTSALASKFSATTLETDSTVDNICGVEQSTDSILWVYNATATGSGDTYRRIRQATVSSAGAVSGVGVLLRGVSLLAAPFVYGGNVYVPAYYMSGGSSKASEGNESCYLLDASGVPCARFLDGQAWTTRLTTNYGLLQPLRVATDGVSKFYLGTVARFSQQLLLDASSELPGPVSIEIDFAARPTHAELGDNVHINAGQIYEYDGASVFESGFHVAPEIISSTTSAAGGSLSDGTYSVSAAYLWFDDHGQAHFSAPAVTTDVVLSGGGAAQQFTVYVPHLKLTARSNVLILLYVVSASGAATLYEAANADNDTTSDEQAFAVTSLSGLTDNRLLYTTGGVLENGSAPRLTSIVRKGRRLYGVTPDGVIAYTKEHVEGEGAAFVEETLVKGLYRDGGDYFALGVMDDVLIALGEESLQLLSGEGMNDTGTLDTLSEPRTIASDVGIVDGTPTVAGPDGLYFKSAKGICRLNRSLQVEYVGAPVEDYNSLTLVSAVLVPSKSQIRFGHSDGVTLVYDYLSGQWSTFTNHTQVDALFWGSTYCLLKSDGTVWQQSTGFADGDGAAITLTLETPWIKLAGLQGFQRLVYAEVLGEFRAAHTLSLTPYFDYSATAGTARSLAQTGTSGDPLQFRVHFGTKCEAVKFRITDSAQSGTKESCTLAALSLELGMKAGLYKQPASKTA